MGGEGSGRKPDPVKKFIQMQQPASVNPESYFIPDYSGVSHHVPTLREFDERYILSGSSIRLDQIANPINSKTFTFPLDKTLTFRSNDNTPSGDTGVFNFEGIGNFTGDLVHIHQHTGNAGANTDLLHIEAEDSDVLPLSIEGTNALSINANKAITCVGLNTSGDINLTNGTSNLINFGNAGYAAPSDNSVGWKMKWYDVAAANSDGGIGLSATETWFMEVSGIDWVWYLNGATPAEKLRLDMDTGNLTAQGSVKGTDLILTSGDIKPLSNSTSALNISQADGTNFVTFDTTNKRVGISQLSSGGITPSEALHLSANGAIGMRLVRSDTGSSGTYIDQYKSRGSVGSETVVSNGDIIMLNRAYGYSANNDYRLAGYYTIKVDGTPATTHVPTKYQLFLEDGTGLIERFTVSANGNANFTNNVSGLGLIANNTISGSRLVCSGISGTNLICSETISGSNVYANNISGNILLVGGSGSLFDAQANSFIGPSGNYLQVDNSTSSFVGLHLNSEGIISTKTISGTHLVLTNNISCAGLTATTISSSHLTVSGTVSGSKIYGSDYYSGDNSQGITQTVNITDLAGYHTLVFKDGLLTSYTFV